MTVGSQPSINVVSFKCSHTRTETRTALAHLKQLSEECILLCIERLQNLAKISYGGTDQTYTVVLKQLIDFFSRRNFLHRDIRKVLLRAEPDTLEEA